MRPPLMSNVRPHGSAATNAAEIHFRNGRPAPSVLRRPANQSLPATRLLSTVSPGRRPSAASEPLVPHASNASNPFVPTSARSSQVGRVRFPLKRMNVECIIVRVTGSNRRIKTQQQCAAMHPRRPCGVPQRLGRRSGQAPAIARAARRRAVWLPVKCRPPPQCGLTLPSRGRPQAGFAHLRPPLMSNVRPLNTPGGEALPFPQVPLRPQSRE